MRVKFAAPCDVAPSKQGNMMMTSGGRSEGKEGGGRERARRERGGREGKVDVYHFSYSKVEPTIHVPLLSGGGGNKNFNYWSDNSN